MATSTSEQTKEIKDFSKGVQRETSKFLHLENEQEMSVNADYSRVGAVGKIFGYTILGNTITTSSTSTSTTTTTTSTSTSTSSTSSSTSTSSTTTPP